MNARSNSSEDRVFTIPNIISITRLLLMPLFVIALFPLHARFFAACLLAVLGISDGLDGYIARHFHQMTKLGQKIDPLADRVLFSIVIVSATVDGSVPKLIIAISALREIVVISNTLLAARRHVHWFGVHWFGKAYTFGLMVAFPLFLASHTSLSIRNDFRALAYVWAIPSLIFGWISAGIYITKAKRLVPRSLSDSVPTSVSSHGNSL